MLELAYLETQELDPHSVMPDFTHFEAVADGNLLQDENDLDGIASS